MDTCKACGCNRQRHEIEPPYPCYDCDCASFSFVAPNYFDNPLNRQTLDRFINDCGPEREDA